MQSPSQTCKLVAEQLSEAERLTLQRYAAVAAGYDANIPHMMAKFWYLIENAHNRHHRAMADLMAGRNVAADRCTDACMLFAQLLDAIETPTP